MWTSMKISSRLHLPVHVSYFASCVTENDCSLLVFISQKVTVRLQHTSNHAHIRIFSDYPSTFLPQVLLSMRIPPLLNPAVVLARVLPLPLIQVPVQEQDPLPTPAPLMLLPLVGMHTQERGWCYCPSERRAGRRRRGGRGACDCGYGVNVSLTFTNTVTTSSQ